MLYQVVEDSLSTGGTRSNLGVLGIAAKKTIFDSQEITKQIHQTLDSLVSSRLHRHYHLSSQTSPTLVQSHGR